MQDDKKHGRSVVCPITGRLINVDVKSYHSL